jgi:hypothetical protein
LLDLWIRLKNVSAAQTEAPIEVEIRKSGSGMDERFAEFAAGAPSMAIRKIHPP